MALNVLKTMYAVVFTVVWTSTPWARGSTPPFPGPWTTVYRRDAGFGAADTSTSKDHLNPLDSSLRERLELEGQAAKEIRESFGDEFARQLDEEREILQKTIDQKERVGREAGCSPTSPLSSSRGAVEGRGLNAEDGLRKPSGVYGPMSDWLP